MLIGETETNKQNNTNHIKDVNSDSFMSDVIEASKTTPIIVDFWAPWCGPCKDLGPLIEKAVNNANGKVILAKVNIDENQAVAAQLRIQSIPTVYAFVDGQPVDGFNGAKPESEINAFVKKISDLNKSGPNLDELIEVAKTELSSKNFETAKDNFENILSIDATKTEAVSGYIRSLTGLKEIQIANEFLSSLDEKIKNNSLVQDAIKALKLSEKASNEASNVDKLKKIIEQDPNNLQSRQDLAMALYGAGEIEDALNCLLLSIEINLDWNEQAARKQLIEFFSATGHSDPLIVSARKRLSSLFFK